MVLVQWLPAGECSLTAGARGAGVGLRPGGWVVDRPTWPDPSRAFARPGYIVGLGRARSVTNTTVGALGRRTMMTSVFENDWRRT